MNPLAATSLNSATKSPKDLLLEEYESKKNDFKISFLSKQQDIVAHQNDSQNNIDASLDNRSNDGTLENLADRSDDSVYESTYQNIAEH